MVALVVFGQVGKEAQTFAQLDFRLRHRGARDRLFTGLPSIADRLSYQTRLLAVVSKQLGVGSDGILKLIFQYLGNPGMQQLPLGAQ